MAPHILVVGGTGMLSGLVEALAGDGGRLSLLSRRASVFGGANITGYDVDYYDDSAFMAALDAAGPIDLAIAWFHTLKIGAAGGWPSGSARPATRGACSRCWGAPQRILPIRTGSPKPRRSPRVLRTAGCGRWCWASRSSLAALAG
ncbi:hypothetical protein [Phenylobacterium sp.]|uniref:hypothetical protein n=1 Tax=Phenylobacterium sp. TaxID=1871053 RepID=UPI002E2F3521|nr:hypothetical protein [Phenylobacterium sp.]HEX4710123.1 hypothetical protein [Phenylobacterium sp.]